MNASSKPHARSHVHPALPAVTVWGQYNTGQYIATVVFSYICFAMLILFFLALVLFQGAVTDELGICEARAPSLYAAVACMHGLQLQLAGVHGLGMDRCLVASSHAAAVRICPVWTC
jgi:hypothetical protein